MEDTLEAVTKLIHTIFS